MNKWWDKLKFDQKLFWIEWKFFGIGCNASIQKMHLNANDFGFLDCFDVIRRKICEFRLYYQVRSGRQ